MALPGTIILNLRDIGYDRDLALALPVYPRDQGPCGSCFV